MKRCVIFFFYDKDGIVDRYLLNILSDLRTCCERILFVCNGTLAADSRKALRPYTDDILVRDNTGFDVWAYREGLLYFGWDTVIQYDELVLMNFTIFPTMHSFAKMFQEMEQVPTDFWGVTNYFEGDTAVAGHVPDHIQSHFIAVRKSMSASFEFRNYWENMPPIGSYQDSVRLHESRFTSLFEGYGFRSCVYADAEELRPLIDCPVQWRQQYLIEKTKTPLVKRKTFFYQPYDGIATKTAGEAASDTFRYLREQEGYDTQAIIENLLRTSSMTDIKNALQLNYILPSSGECESHPEEAAVILYVDTCVCAEQFQKYLTNIPRNAKIHLIASADEQQRFQEMLSSYSVTLHEKREDEDAGAAVLRLLGQCVDHSYLLLLRFQVRDRAEYAAAYKAMECLLKSRAFVANVIHTFEQEPQLGMLFPSPPNSDRFTETMGREWADVKAETIAAAERLGVPIDKKNAPAAPYMGMCWCRGAAVKEMLEWLPQIDLEPSRETKDGPFRIWDIVPVLLMQKAGYYSGWLYSSEFAGIEITNLHFYLNKLLLAADSDAKENIWQIVGKMNHRRLSLADCSVIPTRVLLRQLALRSLPKPVSRFFGLEV